MMGDQTDILSHGHNQYVGGFLKGCITLWNDGVKFGVNINVFAYHIYIGGIMHTNISIQVSKTIATFDISKT